MTGKPVVIHTDGACSGNPGPGGWAAILRYGATEKELSGGEASTTNNRMELMAAIMAIEALTRPSTVEMHTDSNYLREGITRWIHGWKRNGWKTADKKPVKNVELWQRLEQALEKHDVAWHWVRGHAGHDDNERADALAREAMAPYKLRLRPSPAGEGDRASARSGEGSRGEFSTHTPHPLRPSAFATLSRKARKGRGPKAS